MVIQPVSSPDSTEAHAQSNIELTGNRINPSVIIFLLHNFGVKSKHFFFMSKRHDDVWCCLVFDCSGPSCREVHLNWLLCWIFTSSFRHDDFLQDSFRPCKRQDSSLHFQSTISCLAQRHSLHTLKSVTKTPAWRSDCVVNFCLSFLSVVSLCRHLVGFNDRACHFYSITTIYACIKAVWVRAASE